MFTTYARCPLDNAKWRRYVRVVSEDQTLVDNNALGYSQVSAQVTANTRNACGRLAVVTR
jgi:hypothetical protein